MTTSVLGEMVRWCDASLLEKVVGNGGRQCREENGESAPVLGSSFASLR